MLDLSGVTISATKPDGKPARALAGLGITILPLEAEEGDADRYVLGPRVAVERRTGSTFLRGIQEKTLFTGAIALRECFPIAVLLLEGEVDSQYSRFDPQAVRGALSALVLQYGLSVLPTRDVDETARLLAMMARQEQLGIPEVSLIPKRKAADLPDLQRRVVEMLPGVGMVTARRLLQRFGSVRRILTAPARALTQVPGIGAKTAAEIRRVLDADYEAIDTEKDLEDAIEADPTLLFDEPVELLARQHVLFTEGGERCAVDLAFLDPAAREVILVELKQGNLVPAHRDQLRRYLAHAHCSFLLGPLLQGDHRLRGVLASVGEAAFTPTDPDIATRTVDRARAIAVLKQRRREECP